MATPSTQFPCPDPSAHDKVKGLGEQASTAALYATNPSRDTVGNNNSLLDRDGKLSSASAATSLKQARPQDLPGYPIVGIDKQTSAGAAANIANANPRNIEWWKPEVSNNAEKAALLAKDYKTQPVWRPEISAAGSKAALYAHRDGAKVNLWTPGSSAIGNSAAEIAMRKKEPLPISSQNHANDGKIKALSAANGAVTRRKRSDSTPLPTPRYPDAANSSRNALSAATSAHRPSKITPSFKLTDKMGSEALEAARIKHIGTKLPREMYSEHPPVAPEVEEKKHQDALRASAISMAKKMYEVQQRHIDDAAGVSRSDGQAAASRVHRTESANAPEKDLRQQAMQFLNVQEAAQKLAAERLAKIQGDDLSTYRDYYGYNHQRRSRLSIRKGRRRASSDGEMNASEDESQSRRIRSQLSQLQTQLAGVDEKKRRKDKEALLAAAEQRVQARMHEMDEKVYNDTGKVSNAMMEEWEARAREKAKAESNARMANHGKVDIGGGKFLDQADIDAVAAARIKPTLDEINEAAERQRAKDEEIRLDMEERKRQAQVEKQREFDVHSEQRRIKEEEKTAARIRKADEKQAARSKKESEKAARVAEKRMNKEQKRKPKESHRQEVTRSLGSVETTSPNPNAVYKAIKSELNGPEMPRRVSQDDTPVSDVPEHPNEDTVQLAERQNPEVPDSNCSASPTSQKGFKALVNKLKRRSKGSTGDGPTSPTKMTEDRNAIKDEAVKDKDGPVSIMASAEGKQEVETISDHDSSSVSSLYSEDDQIRGNKWKSKMRTKEEMEEERDDFNDKLAPPPKFTYGGNATGSPVRETRFHEEM